MPDSGGTRLVEWVMRMFAVVGEALVDLVRQPGGRTFFAHPGGSPANVALGLARLGVAVTLRTRLGQDAFGEMVLAHLEASGVRVDGCADEGAKTSLAIATLASWSRVLRLPDRLGCGGAGAPAG